MDKRARNLKPGEPGPRLYEERTQFPNVIDLNVDGRYVTTKLSTLTKYPRKMLASMFSGRQEIDKDKDGRYVIDCDSKIFGHILEFLRFESLPYGNVVDAVLEYLEFFGLRAVR
ncbi:BTB/POZ domain-containing protein KCTD7-like isoform X2 [Dreissena polymorpha]|uniref:Potassium channel tetramerisation-type BTB domain-containing protein n=1 Tax=Dreissena polymorpha TaxID=45954 RepID=A0A9D4NLB4_DREPO|nr:BTB/POZ domain-containing protein KCTD7-like isoform X2 [Dreissena polymorpha]KAH3896708.1 hypothetical protein DPMN_020887 [Dreissena polymorpha]